MTAPSRPVRSGGTASVDLPPWRGEPVEDLTVDPEGTPRVVRSGCHERLHRRLVGSFDPVGALDDPPESLFRGTKVDLALVGWAQINVDGMTDRVHADAPDGLREETVLRRFARVHRAGALRITFYPSMETVRFAPPGRLRLSRSGLRVPVPLPAAKTSRTTQPDTIPGG